MTTELTSLIWFLYHFSAAAFRLADRLWLSFEAGGQLKPESELIKLGLSKSQASAWRQAKPELVEEVKAWLRDPLNGVMGLNDPSYPAALRAISKPPVLLFYRGNPKLLLEPQLAVVGTRHPTPYGIQCTQKLVSELSAQGLTITSGFAHGVDQIAHQQALASGGKTIAVLGSGLINRYPPQSLAISNEQFKERALLISEFPLCFPIQRWVFTFRNRVISGLSRGVLVVEALLKSGSLVTARLAAEQGREVMALPGAITSPFSQGCHHLIQQGAALVQSGADILQHLGLTPIVTQEASSKSVPQLDLDGKTRETLNHIDFASPVSASQLSQQLNLPLSTVKMHLTILLNHNLIEENLAGYRRL